MQINAPKFLISGEVNNQVPVEVPRYNLCCLDELGAPAEPDAGWPVVIDKQPATRLHAACGRIDRNIGARVLWSKPIVFSHLCHISPPGGGAGAVPMGGVFRVCSAGGTGFSFAVCSPS